MRVFDVVYVTHGVDVAEGYPVFAQQFRLLGLADAGGTRHLEGEVGAHQVFRVRQQDVFGGAFFVVDAGPYGARLGDDPALVFDLHVSFRHDAV